MESVFLTCAYFQAFLIPFHKSFRIANLVFVFVHAEIVTIGFFVCSYLMRSSLERALMSLIPDTFLNIGLFCQFRLFEYCFHMLKYINQK